MNRQDIKKEQERVEKFTVKFSRKTGFDMFLTKYRVAEILKHCSGRETLLELGCSYGRITKELSPYFKRIVGVDGSKEAIRIMKEENNLANVSYIASLIESLDLNEKFDVVLLSFVLEHVFDPQAILRKSAKFLKDNGILFIMVPNFESLHRRVGKEMGLIKQLDELNPADIEHGHRRVYNLEGLTRNVAEAGLKINEKGAFFIKPLSNSQMEQFDPKVCDALYGVSKDIYGLGSMLFVSASKDKSF